MRVTLRFAVESELPDEFLYDFMENVLWYTFIDGVNVLTEENSELSDFDVRAIAGEIVTWKMRATTPPISVADPGLPRSLLIFSERRLDG